MNDHNDEWDKLKNELKSNIHKSTHSVGMLSEVNVAFESKIIAEYYSKIWLNLGIYCV